MFIIDFLQKLFCPWRCLSCGKFDTIVCSDCLRKLEFLKNRAWESVRGDQHLNIYSFFAYQESSGLLRRLVKLLKYQGVEAVSKVFENILLKNKKTFKKEINFEGKIYYVPVPLHPRRYCERGFNQAVLLAKIFEKIWPGEVLENLLVRSQYTVPQAKLNKFNRLENLQGKFKLNQKILEKLDKNAWFILVDDVVTTGSTLWSLLFELKKIGIVKYSAVSLVRD